MQAVEDPDTAQKEPTFIALFCTSLGSKSHLQPSKVLFSGPQSVSRASAPNRH